MDDEDRLLYPKNVLPEGGTDKKYVEVPLLAPTHAAPPASSVVATWMARPLCAHLIRLQKPRPGKARPQAGLCSEADQWAVTQAMLWASSSVLCPRRGLVRWLSLSLFALLFILSWRLDPVSPLPPPPPSLLPPHTQSIRVFRFFPQWPLLPGAQASGKALSRAGMCLLQGIPRAVGCGRGSRF